MHFNLSVPFFVFSFIILIPSYIWAAEEQNPYQPSKVVYDVSNKDPIALENILDRVSFLQNIYDNNPFEASIVIVVHEGAIPLFTKNNNQKLLSQLMGRARSLSMGDVIQFRICEASARMQKITQSDLHDFTTMVPMADAEIIQLQQRGFAYMR